MGLDWWEWEAYFQDLYDEIEHGRIELLEDSVSSRFWSQDSLDAFTRLREQLPLAEEFPYALLAALEDHDENNGWAGPTIVGDTEWERAASMLTGPEDWTVTVVDDVIHGVIHVFYSAWDPHLALYLLASNEIGEFSPV